MSNKNKLWLLGCFLAVCLSSPAHAAYVGIHAAAADGDLAGLALFLAQDPSSINARNGPNRTPLCVAAMRGQTDAVKFLLTQGADVNDRGFENLTPLADMASGWGLRDDLKCAEIATVLLSHGAFVDSKDAYQATPLRWAVESHKSQLAKVLLEHGASQTVTFTGPYAHLTPFYFSLEHKDQPMIELLLQFKPPLENVDQDGLTPLQWEIKYGETNMVRRLLEQGASPNPATNLVNSGLTPFQQSAIQMNHLIQSPLFYALQRNQLGLVALLLQYHARTDEQDARGNTPLHYAVMRKDPQLVSLLLQYHAPVNILNQDGETPLNAAELTGDKEVAGLIRKAQAVDPTIDLGPATPSVPSEETIKALAQRIINGEPAALGELDQLTQTLYQGVDFQHDHMRIRVNAQCVAPAYKLLGEAAGQGNERALDALKEMLHHQYLKGSVPEALAVAATQGNQDALAILLNPKSWGILDSSSDLALDAPELLKLDPVINYYISRAMLNVTNFNRNYGEYLNPVFALRKAAENGNLKAGTALANYEAAMAVRRR